MPSTVAIAMFGWIAVVIVLFATLPRERALAVSFVFAWLALPVAAYPVPGLPDYNKLNATCAAPLVAVAACDFKRVLALRPCWADIPVLALCISPFASSLQNGLGVHDGISGIFAQSLSWGAPYLLGRLYFQEFAALRELATTIVAGAIAYVPLLLFELWSGLELSYILYGYKVAVPVPTFGIIRPRVFLETGLMLALWMAAATVVAIWMWKAGVCRRIGGIRAGWFVAVLVGAVLLMRSVNGWIALAVGTAVLVSSYRWRSRVPIACILILISAYIAIRASGVWSGNEVVAPVGKVLNETKGRSIAFRLVNENVIAKHTRDGHLLFGWGRQEAGFRHPETGEHVVPDSMWIIFFATYGAVGLASLVATVLTPVAAFVRAIPPARWSDPMIAPAAALTALLTVYMVDNLANSMIQPAFMLAAGGLSGISAYSGAGRLALSARSAQAGLQ